MQESVSLTEKGRAACHQPYAQYKPPLFTVCIVLDAIFHGTPNSQCKTHSSHGVTSLMSNFTRKKKSIMAILLNAYSSFTIFAPGYKSHSRVILMAFHKQWGEEGRMKRNKMVVNAEAT